MPLFNLITKRKVVSRPRCCAAYSFSAWRSQSLPRMQPAWAAAAVLAAAEREPVAAERELAGEAQQAEGDSGVTRAFSRRT